MSSSAATPGLSTRSLRDLLHGVDERPTAAAYAEAARRIEGVDGLRPIRVALLPSFTIDPEVPFLKVEAARRGFAADVYVAPFNSIQRELLDPESGCVRHRPDVVFIAGLLEDLSPPLAEEFLSIPSEQVERHAEALSTEVVGVMTAFRQRSAAALVLHNFALRRRPLLGLHEVMAETSQTETIRRLNARLVAAAARLPDAYLLDFDRLCAEAGYANARDDKLWYLGRAPLSASLLPRLARAHAAMADAIFGARRKCLVLDLDNTLWGGIVGEVGSEGVLIGGSFPGNVYQDFQRSALSLFQRGVLLAINSKNNPSDVEEVFRTRPEMVLGWDHFASKRINWSSKPENMQEIAAELNIGLESLVFFDDSPVEQDLMRVSQPEILTLPVPPDPVRFIPVLEESRAFDRLSLTDEDRRRGVMYQEQERRKSLERSAGSVEEFLQGLEMVARIAPASRATLPRVVELLQKTNQFNTTTRRHTAARVGEMAADPRFGVYMLALSDRFGDSGIVGVAILERLDATATIDTFLLSCRVIGRNVETALLAFLTEQARAAGAAEIAGDFFPTRKNAPAADFYSRHGFVRQGDDDATRWRLDLARVPFRWPEFISRPPVGAG